MTGILQGTTKELAKARADQLDLEVLQAFLADEGATSDIEISCAEDGACAETQGWWYDTTKLDGDSVRLLEGADLGFIYRALRYLDLRGLLVRRPGAPHVVSFKPVNVVPE